MVDARSAIAKAFLERVRAPDVWAFVGFKMRRSALAFLLAAIPLVLLAAAAFAGPEDLRKAITSHENVREMFARFITAVATASAIAVSIASLTLGRQMKGVGTLRQRHEADEEFRDRVRESSGRDYVPLSVTGFLRAILQRVGTACRVARANAASTQLALREEEVSLAELLRTLETRAVEVAADLDARRKQPDAVLGAALNFETEVSSHLVERFARDAPAGPLREALEDLDQAMSDYTVASRYVKTLDTQWGLSTMSWAILVATFPSLLTASFMVLSYGEGAVKTLGLGGAGLLVGLATSVALLPLGFFVSYVLRFVFINQHTLPTDGFVLGPEAWDIVQRRPAGGGERRTRA